MKNKISWKLSWNFDLISSNEVHSSISYSSQKSSMFFFKPLIEVCLTYLWEFVHQQLLVSVMKYLEEFDKLSKDSFKQKFVSFSEKFCPLLCEG